MAFVAAGIRDCIDANASCYDFAIRERSRFLSRARAVPV